MVIFVFRSFKFLLQARLSSRFIGKESPDSTEQCTGEEPGPACREQTVPQKITTLRGKDENVR